VPVDHSTLEAISWADPSLGSPLPNDRSYLEAASSVVSADGRYVAFYSYASNLVPGDTNGRYDVFVRDRQTGTTTLVSGGISGPGNGGAFDPSVSADGRFVAFYSNSTNLVTGGTNGNYQVFVRDLQTGTTTLASTGPGGQGNSTSGSPSISANGRYVAFYSSSSNLTPEGGNGLYQVFVRDLQAGTTTLVSTGPNGKGNSQSYYPPALSADGRYVAFASNSTNLVPGGTNGQSQIFLRDLQTGTTRLVSIGAGGQANQYCHDISISADGSRVAFDSGANNLVAGTTTFVSNVYVSDWQSGTIALVSVDSTGQIGNSDSNDPSISASGRYVAFDSRATNLVAGDTNGHYDVFLHDLQTGLTKRISSGTAGEGDNDSYYPSISADGRAVAFNSYADNLVAGFNVQNYEIYLYFNPDNADNAGSLSVGNTSDSGPGSLRQAILYANSLGGSSHTITFALPAGSQTINLLTPLPAVTNSLIVSLDASQNVKIQSPAGNVWGNSNTLRRTGAGSLTVVAGIEGTGSLTVDAGSSFTAGHIVQSSLVIGGTAAAPAVVTIAASDALGNPLVAGTATSASAATDTASNNPQLLASASADLSAVALSSTSTMTAATATSSTPESSPIRVAGALTGRGSLGLALAGNGRPSDSVNLIAQQSSLVTVGVPAPLNPAMDPSGWLPSRYAVGISSPADQAVLRGRQVAAATNGVGALLRRDAIAAAFDDADIQTWLGSTDRFRHSAPEAVSSFLSDDLLAAIGQRWQN
jgi:WD40-like Beta Propeller Repeat